MKNLILSFRKKQVINSALCTILIGASLAISHHVTHKQIRPTKSALPTHHIFKMSKKAAEPDSEPAEYMLHALCSNQNKDWSDVK